MYSLLFRLKIARCVLSKKGLEIVRDVSMPITPAPPSCFKQYLFRIHFHVKKLEKVLEYLLSIDNRWSQNKTMDVKLSAFRRTFQKEINKPTYTMYYKT